MLCLGQRRLRQEFPHSPPVGLIEDDNFLPSWWERDFLLRKSLYAVPHNIDAALVTGIELQDGLLVRISQQLAGQAQDGCRFANARHARDDNVRHVSIFGNDFEALDRFGVAYDIVEEDGAVLFDPVARNGQRGKRRREAQRRARQTMAARSPRQHRLTAPSSHCVRQRWKIRRSPWWRSGSTWWATRNAGLHDCVRGGAVAIAYERRRVPPKTRLGIYHVRQRRGYSRLSALLRLTASGSGSRRAQTFGSPPPER